MDLTELKLISASNIINLRTAAGMTQADLGAALNYSDKTISKWERGEAIPDAFVLTQLAAIFHVNVDYLLSSHDKWTPPQEEQPETPEVTYRTEVIIAIAVLGVWTLALTAFVALWLYHLIRWEIFVVALPVSILVYMVLTCVFHKTRHLQFVIALFVLSLFVTAYLLFLRSNPWQIFLIAILAEVIVFLSFKVRKRPRKAREHREKA